MSKSQSFFPGEEVLLEQAGWWVKSLINAKTGTMVVTDKRVAFIEKKQIVGGGLVAAAADAALGVTRPKLRVDIPFAEMKSFSRPKKVDLVFENSRGETFKLRGAPAEWDQRLEALLGRRES